MRELLLGSICALLITIGQVFWKIALMKQNFSFSSNITIKKIINLIFSPYMFSGIVVYFFATIFWMYLLGKFEYSKIYPMIASAFVFALLFAHFVFHEDIGWYKISGVVFIIIGVFLISKS